MESTLGPGGIIAGRYHLTAQLGQGGMGSVWRAEHLTLRSPVAVKLIDPAIAGQRETLARFQAEAQAAAALRSPHVVQILDYGVDGGVPYIVMELLEGESLAARLLRVGRLPPAETARFVTHVARALARAHEAGIVHRDLKPENVFLVRNDDQELAKVLDFGIAKSAAPGGLFSGKGPTRTGSIIGTPGYMSPEQAQGTKTLDGRSDVWSLGVIAFECIVGQVPFESEALGELLLKICMYPLPVPSQVADVPPGFDAWFARACCREVSGRFQSAKELAEALRAVLVPDSVPSGSASSPSLVPLSPRASLPSVVNAATVVASPSPFDPGAPMITMPSAGGASTPGAPLAPGATMPGMSLAAASGAKRLTGLYVAAALGLVVLGAAGTWLAVAPRNRARGAAPPAMTAAAPLEPSPPTPPTPKPPAPLVPMGETSAAPAPTVEPASSVPEPAAGSSSKPHTPAHHGSSPPPLSRPPLSPPPPSPPPPPRPSPGDRLGF